MQLKRNTENKKTEKRKQKSRIGKLFQGFLLTVSCVATAVQPVYASNVSVNGVTNAITSLKNLMVTVVGGIGLVVLVYNLFNLGQSYQSHDTAAFSQAIKGCVGGLIMASIGAILAFLGY